jgi:hypothetical protein
MMAEGSSETMRRLFYHEDASSKLLYLAFVTPI